MFLVAVFVLINCFLSSLCLTNETNTTKIITVIINKKAKQSIINKSTYNDPFFVSKM